MARPDFVGSTVVITRPLEQGRELDRLLRENGAIPLQFPVMEIADVKSVANLDAQLLHLDRFDLAIFISRNAVEKTMARLSARGKWPSRIKVAAVGAATARALVNAGISPDLVPSTDFNSEALLALPELTQVNNKKIVIFRGEGGREKLAQTLRQRGASVSYIECYRRIKPATDPTPLVLALTQGKVSFVVVTSNAGLDNLFAIMADNRHLLLNIPYVVLSRRTADHAQELGITSQALIASPASDQVVVETMLRA